MLIYNKTQIQSEKGHECISGISLTPTLFFLPLTCRHLQHVFITLRVKKPTQITQSPNKVSKQSVRQEKSQILTSNKKDTNKLSVLTLFNLVILADILVNASFLNVKRTQCNALKKHDHCLEPISAIISGSLLQAKY